MRKVTFILLALLGLCTTAWAQPQDFGDPLITDASQLTSPFGDPEEGLNIGAICDFDANTFWHTNYHDDIPGDYHWVQMELPSVMEGEMVLWILRRTTANDHPSEAVLIGSLTPDFTVEVPIATLTLGNATSGGEFVSEPFVIPSPVKYIRFMPTNCKGSSEGFRTFWHASEINLFQPGSDVITTTMMQDFLSSYDEYLWDPDFNIGTLPGQYSDEASAMAFLEILNTINAIVAGEMERPNDQEIQAMIREARSLFDLYLGSKNDYSLPQDGYYRIVANLDYYTTEETGEVDEFEDPITIRITGIKKSMYSMLEGFGAWHTYDAGDCRDLWHITRNGDNTVNMINAATDMGFSQFGNPVMMSTNPAEIQFMRLVWAGRENDRDIVYVQGYGQTDVMHQLSHQRGAGTGDKLCTWSPTFEMGAPYDSDKGTSEWYLEYVPDEEAQALIAEYQVVKNHDQMVIQYRQLAAEATNQLTIAQSAAREEFITRNTQFSSMVSESSEGSLNNLLDGNGSTFWHSAYNGDRAGSVGGTHFIDVDLMKPVEGTLQAWIQRRAACNNDHPITWSIYGANDEAALQVVADFSQGTADDWRAQTIEGWTLLADSLSTPFDESVPEVIIPKFNLDQPYRYLRFVVEEMLGKTEGTRGFFHLGGMQVFKPMGKSQLEAMGQVGENLLAQLEVAASVEDADLTLDQFNALRAALEAFEAQLQDPTTLRQTITTYRHMADRWVQGTNPGFWLTDTEANALKAAIEAAVEYDKSGAYTPEGLQAQIDAVKAAAKAFVDGANQVKADKWYRLRFHTEETYAEQGWSNENIAAQDGTRLGRLCGQYVAVANYSETGEDEGTPIIMPLETDATREGHSLFFAPLEQITDADAALFRFVEIGDTAVIIQHKGSGLYIHCQAANNNNVTLSLTPTTFKLEALGFGGVLMAGRKLDGTDVTNLHAQRWNHRLVTWASRDYDNNSALLIEEAEDITDFETPALLREMVPGTYYAACAATGIRPAEDSDISLFAVEGTYTQGMERFIALKRISEVQPGQSYVYIMGEAVDYAADAVAETTSWIQTEGEFAPLSGTQGGLIGVYDAVQAYQGAVVFEGNQAIIAEDKVVDDGQGGFISVSTRNVPAGGAYLSFAYTLASPSGQYDLLIPINGTPTVLTEVEKHAGTAEDPFLILSPIDLAYLRSKLVTGRTNYVVLGADIDMASIDSWYPLNMYEDQANGLEYQNIIHFDGQGHVIRNFHYSDPETGYVSFFGILNGDVMNVGFENANVTCLKSGSGILAGYMGHDQYVAGGVKQTSTLTNVWVTGTLRVADNYCGGLVGNIGGPSVMKNVYTNINITGENDYTGGFVGRVRDMLHIENAYAAGTLNRGGGMIGGGQKDSTAPGVYKNIVVWNNATQNFGPLRAGVDTTEGISYFDGTNHAALQQTVVGWGTPWTCTMAEGAYPTFGQGTPDGINTIEAKPAARRQGIYTINGIRVEKTTRGLYIIDGKKVMVK